MTYKNYIIIKHKHYNELLVIGDVLCILLKVKKSL
jgi:hypothetical protein